MKRCRQTLKINLNKSLPDLSEMSTDIRNGDILCSFYIQSCIWILWVDNHNVNISNVPMGSFGLVTGPAQGVQHSSNAFSMGNVWTHSGNFSSSFLLLAKAHKFKSGWHMCWKQNCIKIVCVYRMNTPLWATVLRIAPNVTDFLTDCVFLCFRNPSTW